MPRVVPIRPADRAAKEPQIEQLELGTILDRLEHNAMSRGAMGLWIAAADFLRLRAPKAMAMSLLNDRQALRAEIARRCKAG